MVRPRWLLSEALPTLFGHGLHIVTEFNVRVARITTPVWGKPWVHAYRHEVVKEQIAHQEKTTQCHKSIRDNTDVLLLSWNQKKEIRVRHKTEER